MATDKGIALVDRDEDGVADELYAVLIDWLHGGAAVATRRRRDAFSRL